MSDRISIEQEHGTRVRALETAQRGVDALHARLAAAKEELAGLDARRKAAFADQLARGIEPNVDDHLWRRIQLEAEISDLPFAIQRARSVANSHEAAVAGLAHRISDARRDQERNAMRARIAARLVEGATRVQLPGETNLTQREFDELAPPRGGMM